MDETDLKDAIRSTLSLFAQAQDWSYENGEKIKDWDKYDEAINILREVKKKL